MSLGSSPKSYKKYDKKSYRKDKDKKRDDAYVYEDDHLSPSERSYSSGDESSLDRANAELYAMSFNDDESVSLKSSASSDRSRERHHPHHHYHQQAHRTHTRRGRKGGRRRG